MDEQAIIWLATNIGFNLIFVSVDGMGSTYFKSHIKGPTMVMRLLGSAPRHATLCEI